MISWIRHEFFFSFSMKIELEFEVFSLCEGWRVVFFFLREGVEASSSSDD